MPELADTQPASGAPAPESLVQLAVIKAVHGPGSTQLSNILKGAYGSYQDGCFVMDPALRRADERFLPAELRYTEPGGVIILDLPRDLLPVVKANLAATLKARWADMYNSLRGPSQADSTMAQMLNNDEALARQAMDAIAADTGATQAFISPMQAKGLLVKWRATIPNALPTGDDGEVDPDWTLQEQPFGKMHAGVTLSRGGDIMPCPEDAAFGALEARAASNPVDASQDRADGTLLMRVFAPSAELAQAYADLIAQDRAMRDLVFSVGHPSAFQLESVGAPYAPQVVELEAAAQSPVEQPQLTQAPVVDSSAQVPEAPALPPADEGFFADDAPPPPQQIERPRERG